MVDCGKFMKKLIYVQLLVFVFTVIIYGLSVSILNDTITNASIASSQFAGDGVSLSGIFIGVIVLGAFNLFIQIAFSIAGSIITSRSKSWSISWSWYLFILGLINLLFNLISEALFFKFATCFSFKSNAILGARYFMVILLMTILIGVAFGAIIKKFFLNLDCRGSNCFSEIDVKIDKFDALIPPLLFLPSIAMFILNAILIDQLPQGSGFNVQPSSLRMGFFNQIEIRKIENGETVYFIEQQIIGNLGDVIHSPNKVFAHTACSTDSNGQQSCTDNYLRKYSYQITCTSQSVSFYKDCANASSLTIYITYLDSGPYPSYNCLVNQANKTCASYCTQLLSNYQLILIQEGVKYSGSSIYRLVRIKIK